MTFQELISDSASWLQKRWINSLELFYSLLFLKYSFNQDEELGEYIGIITHEEANQLQEENVVMGFQELRLWYQHFCFQYNFPQSNILSNKSKSLLEIYGFEINYEKRIVFEDQGQQYGDWKNCKLTFDPLVSKYIQNINQILPQIPEKGYISLPYLIYLSQKNDKQSNIEVNSSQQNSKYKEELTSNLFKVSQDLVLSRKRKSKFILNKMLITQMKKELGMNVLRINNLQNENENLKFEFQNNQQKEFYNYRDFSDLRYLQAIFFSNGTQITPSNLGYFLQSLFNTIIFLASPAFLLIFQIIGTLIYLKEMEKTYERQSTGTEDIIWGFYQNPILNFSFITSYIFGISFLLQFKNKRFFQLSNDSKIPFKLILDRVSDIQFGEAEEMVPQKIKKCSFIWIYFAINTMLLTFLILVLIFFILAISIILIIGSIMIPKATLPSLIFLVALVTVIFNQVVQFKSLREVGESKLNEIFKNNFSSKFEKYIKKISRYQTANEQIEQQNIIYQEADFYDLGELDEIYSVLVDPHEGTVMQNSMYDLFEKMEMTISQQYLDQMFAHAKILTLKDENENTIFLGDKNLLRLNRREFQDTIKYFLRSKVKLAFSILKISNIHLLLSIMNLIMQSFLIMVLVYSVFKGLQAKEEPFSLGIDNITSIAGIFGIMLSNRDKQAKQLEDDTILLKIVKEVEEIFHGQNINFENEVEEIVHGQNIQFENEVQEVVHGNSKQYENGVEEIVDGQNNQQENEVEEIVDGNTLVENEEVAHAENIQVEMEDFNAYQSLTNQKDY